MGSVATLAHLDRKAEAPQADALQAEVTKGQEIIFIDLQCNSWQCGAILGF